MNPMAMRRKLVIVIAFLAFAFLAFHLRFQPADHARLIRRSKALEVLKGRVGVGSRLGSESCLVPLQRGELWFDRTVALEASSGEPVALRLKFGYEPPDKLSARWPAGDWCASLAAEVDRLAAAWGSRITSDEILADRRSASRAVADAITRELANSGVRVLHPTAFIEPSAEMTATRSVAEIAKLASQAPPLLFVGLDGADWQLLDRYMADGTMPNLAALVREGHGGILSTQHPPLSPLLWTTMMTGRSPLDHQILDFTRFHPETGQKEPITGSERKVPAIWNMAAYGRKSTAVLGLWATYPAEPIRGLMVSDRLFAFLYREDSPPPGIVYPASREQWARDAVQRAEQKVDFALLHTYLPWLSEGEYEQARKREDPYAHPVSALRRILVETEVYHWLAMDYLSNQNPDLAILYLQGTDSIGHVFAPFSPPRQQEISPEDYEKYHAVPQRYFQYIDSLIGDYRRVVEQKQGVLMLASDHGFRWSEGRPTELSSFAAATAAKWHRDEGMYLLWGKGIRSRPDHPGRGGIAQICATLLALTNLPPDEGLAGPPLPGAGADRIAAVDYASHYRPPKSLPAAATSSGEELAKLRALGYIGAGESLAASTAAKGTTRTAGWYNNQGLILRDGGRTEQAIAAFEQAIEIDSNLASALWNLSDMLFARKELDRADELLVRAFSSGLPEGKKFLIGRAIGYQRSGSPERSLQLLDHSVNAKPRDPELRMFRGRYRIELRRCAPALEDFRFVIAVTPRDPVPYASAGIAALCLGDRQSAATYFRQSLELNPNQPRLRAYLR